MAEAHRRAPRSGALLPAMLLLLAVTVATAEEGREPSAEPTPTTWVFEKGGLRREVDVSSLPPEVRDEVRKRLLAQGFRCVDDPGSPTGDGAAGEEAAGEAARAEARREARRREIRELVRRGGRFPEAGRVLDRETLDRTRALLRGAARDAPFEAPGPQVPFLGALATLDPSPPGGALRLVVVPPGSLARAVGLVAGDRIVALDGRPPRPAGLAGWAQPERWTGQRTLVVRRTVGRIEHWRLRVERGPGRPAPQPGPGRKSGSRVRVR